MIQHSLELFDLVALVALLAIIYTGHLTPTTTGWAFTDTIHADCVYKLYIYIYCIYCIHIIYIYGDDSIQSCMRSLLSQHRVHCACFSPQMVYGSIGIHPSVTLSTTSYTNIYLSTILYKRKQVCFAKVLLSIATLLLLSSLLHSLWFLLWI